MKFLSVFVLIVTILMPAVHAESTALTPENQASFLWNTGVSHWDSSDVAGSIVCFDVNARGEVAVGLETAHHQCYVSVIDSDDQWLYGYSFRSSGSFAVEWAGTDAITIYWIRSSVYGTFDSQANCLELAKYCDDSAWSQRLRDLQSPERTVNGTRYALDTNLGVLSPFATSYSRVLRYADDGQMLVLVDTHGGNIVGALFVLGIVIFLAIVWIHCCKQHKRGWRAS